MLRGYVKTITILLAFMGLVQSPALANSGRGARSHPGHSGPPPEAIEACRDKSDGDSVEFTTPNGDKISAVCKTIDGKLAAIPTKMPAGRPEGPPPDERGDGGPRQDE